jgi:uncharacterized iron-regulated membrane protein
MTPGLVPGQVVVGAAVVGFVLLSVMFGLVIVAVVAGTVIWWRDRQHDVGPDALRLLEDLDAHLDGFALEDPEVQAGLARLNAAVRGEQPGGEAS